MEDLLIKALIGLAGVLSGCGITTLAIYKTVHLTAASITDLVKWRDEHVLETKMDGQQLVAAQMQIATLNAGQASMNVTLGEIKADLRSVRTDVGQLRNGRAKFQGSES